MAHTQNMNKQRTIARFVGIEIAGTRACLALTGQTVPPLVLAAPVPAEPVELTNFFTVA